MTNMKPKEPAGADEPAGDAPAAPLRVTRQAARLTVALALQVMAMWGAGSFWYFTMKPLPLGWPLYAGLALACATLAGLALLAAWRPERCADLPRWRLAACVVAACCAVATCVAVATGGSSVTGTALACACVACWPCLALSLLSCGCALVRLELGERLACVAVASAAAISLRGLSQDVIAAGRGSWLLAGSMLAGIAALLLTRRETDGVFTACAEAARDGASPADLELTQPSSFLPLRHRLYLMLTPFGFVAGLAFYFGIDSGYVNASALSALPLVALALVAVKMRRRLDLDALYVTAFVMAAGAFLSIGFVMDDTIQISVTLFGAAEACFYVLMLAMLAAIARRNERNAVVVFAWGLCLYLLGYGILGFTFNLLANAFMHRVPLMVFPLAWLFVAFNAWVMHGFSVRQAVESVEETRKITPAPGGPQGLPARPDGASGDAGQELDARLGTLAADARLTDREREVFELLARGRNARYLQDELNISRNTAKTHIAHVYTKLGVHSQQELIDLVQ